MAITKELFPVAGDPSAATANTALLQSFIDDGGGVVHGDGDIYINDTLLIGDGEQLFTRPGTRLALANSSNCLMLGTKAFAASWSSVTAVWSAGQQVTITWTAHGLIKGDWICLQGESGTTIAVWWENLQVISISDANTIIVRLPFTPAASPTGALTAKKLQRNVRVDVDLNFRYTNNGGGTSTDRMASIWAFLVDSDIKVRGTDVTKYVAMLAGAVNTHIEAEAYGTTNSDTLKIYGPSLGITATASGAASEDCVSVQALEPAAFIAYMPCRGNIHGVKLKNVNAHAISGGSGGLMIYADGTFVTEGIEIDGGYISGTGSNGTPTPVPAIGIKNGDGTGNLNVRDVTIKGGVVLASGAAPPVKVMSRIRTLRFDGVRFIPPVAVTDGLVSLLASCGADELIVENVTFDLGAWPATTGYLFVAAGNSIATSIVFRNCTFRGSTAGRVLWVPSTSSVRTVLFDQCEADSIDALVRVDPTPTITPTVIIRGGRYNDVPTGVNARVTGVKVVADGAYFEDMVNGLVRAEIAGTNVELYERGCTFAGTSKAFVCLTTATVDLKAQHLVADIGATGVNKTAGNACMHVGSTRGTILTGTPVMADGTNWRSILDPSLLY